MDFIDWIMYLSGGAFGLLTLGLGLSRASAFTERDVNPVWWLGFIVFGGLLAGTLIIDWIVPIETTIYLANGSDIAHEVVIGGETICLPGKSYDSFHWRLDSPTQITIRSENNERDQYPIGKGTWLINTSTILVSADMYQEDGMGISYDAMTAQSRGAIHVSSNLGKPFRMFSQSSFDRVYDPSGDVQRRSHTGPCSNDDGKKR
ncbi:MAG TPA: hypothetical protein VGG27_13730 [Magnetospirillaceae bacterium]|jgi:hypothetical protein